MRFPWRRRIPSVSFDPAAGEEAVRARRDAEANLAQARAKWADVHAERARQEQQKYHAKHVRVENHFAERFRHVLEGGR